MQVSLIALDELRLVAIKVVGRRSELSHRVPLAWLDLVRRGDEIPDRTEPDLFYGVFLDGPHQGDETDPVHAYWVAAPVRSFDSAPDELARLVVPARTYATATVRGAADRIDAAYIALGRWMQENDRHPPPDAYGLERYDTRRQKVTPPYERFDYDVLRPLG